MSFLPTPIGNANLAQVPREILCLAEALSRKHGTVHLAHESSGTHLYLASPKCLEQDGPIELEKRHLAINVDKYLRLGIRVLP